MIKGLISVVIINFNSDKYIWNCLECIRAQTYNKLEVFVIDNCSSDGSSEKLQKIQGDDFYYHRFDTNVGSSVANNYGIKNSHGEFVLVLNADVFLNKDYVEQSIKEFGRDEKIGTVTGKLLSESNNQVIDTTGIIVFKEGVGAERGMGEVDNGQYDFVDYVVGACCASALYKREMLEDIEYEGEFFDEDMFAFVEDFDLAIMSTLLGWKTLYVYRAVGFHVRGGSTKNVSEFVRYLNIRNSKLCYIKLLSGCRRINLYNQVFRLFRYFTVDNRTRLKVDRDIQKLAKKYASKQNFYRNKIVYSNLIPYLNKSYLTERIKLMFRKSK